ncbi:MAG: hypothetical protein OZ919_09850 [Xanthomonadaceae bacterium]|jgi:hypothetical protein|nr:hypothetical protein [Xanthomonadaceae bacterium]
MIRLVESRQEDFMRDNIQMLSWNASVQRAHLYNPGVSESDRVRMKEDMFRLLETDIVPSYRVACTESAHLENIGRLVQKGSGFGSSILVGGQYRYGVAQKLLNLYLKYLWCMGHVAEPPHCPVDRIILAETTLRDRLNWTKITTREQYMSAINALRQVATAQGQSLAVWELLNYRSNRK